MSYSDKIFLDEFVIIGGNDFSLKINMLDSLGLPYDLTSHTSSIKICSLGDYPNEIDEILGTILSNQITYIIPSTLTSTMNGKYIYQQFLVLPDTRIISLKQASFMVMSEI